MINIDFIPIQIQPTAIPSKIQLYKEFKPAHNLKKYICCYWYSPIINRIETNYKSLLQKELVMPDGCIDVLFGMDMNKESCRNILAGTMSASSVVDMEHGDIETFGIRFYPGGLQAFIGEGSDKFADKMEFLDTIEQPVFMEFGRNLRRFNSIESKINYANEYFTSKIRASIPFEEDFQNILSHIYKTKGIVKIKDIVEQDVISEKKLRRIFYNRIGINTKAFIRIIRFQNVLRMIKVNNTDKIVNLAVDAGYYDESHLIHDFYDFSGMNPTDYIIKK